MIEAVLFDLDGTLADTALDLGGALNRLLQEEGRVPLPVQSTQHKLYIGVDLRDVQAGHAAGIRTIAAAWGYLGEGLPIEQWKADGIAVNPADVTRLIKAAC